MAKFDSFTNYNVHINYKTQHRGYNIMANQS